MTRQTCLVRPTVSLWMLLAALGCTGARAAGKSVDQAAQEGRAQYQRDFAVCAGSKFRGDRAECRNAAFTAFALTQPVPLDDDPGRYARNALKRCEALTGDAGRDCIARMQGQGSSSGSVSGGGIYRELVTREEVKPPVDTPQAASAAAPRSPTAPTK